MSEPMTAKRLAEIRERASSDGMNVFFSQQTASELLAHIDHLTGELEAAKNVWSVDSISAQLATLAAENERLRAALTKIVDEHKNWLDDDEATIGYLEEAIEEGAAALAAARELEGKSDG